jgi:hypothetical protein
LSYKKIGDLFPQKLVRLVEFTQEKQNIIETRILQRKILLGLASTTFLDVHLKKQCIYVLWLMRDVGIAFQVNMGNKSF